MNLQVMCTQISLSQKLPIYGASSKVSELSETKPISPYGRSKLFCEKILQDCANSLNISFISLRYFNVIGADKKLRYGPIGLKNKSLTNNLFNKWTLRYIVNQLCNYAFRLFK